MGKNYLSTGAGFLPSTVVVLLPVNTIPPPPQQWEEARVLHTPWQENAHSCTVGIFLYTGTHSYTSVCIYIYIHT